MRVRNGAAVAAAAEGEEELLSDVEVEALLRALLRKRGVSGATEAELAALLEWAREVRLAGVLLEAVLCGVVGIDWSRGEPRFTAG